MVLYGDIPFRTQRAALQKFGNLLYGRGEELPGIFYGPPTLLHQADHRRLEDLPGVVVEKGLSLGRRNDRRCNRNDVRNGFHLREQVPTVGPYVQRIQDYVPPWIVML